MKLVLAEKPSVAQSIAKVLGATKREDGYIEGNGYIVSWCVGHLVELAEPEAYDAKYSKWTYNDLPIFPMNWQYEVSSGTKKQFGILKKLIGLGFSPLRTSRFNIVSFFIQLLFHNSPNLLHICKQQFDSRIIHSKYILQIYRSQLYCTYHIVLFSSC